MLIKFVLIFSLLTIVKSAKILVVAPTPSISHQVVFRPLIQELINRNHEVTVITTDPAYPHDESPKKLNEINVHDLSYALWLNVSKSLSKKEVSNLTKMKNIFGCFSKVAIEQLKVKSIVELLSDPTIKFDLLILSSFTAVALVYSHIFQAPVILMSTYGPLPGNMKMIGSPLHPLLYPTHYHKKLYNLTVWERIYEMYIDVAYNSLHENQELDDDAKMKNLLGLHTPTFNELKNNINMLFLKVNPIWLHNPPVPPTVAYTWGVHKPLEKMLPTELQSYLDSSKQGVIFVSFGSILKTAEIPPEVLQTLLTVFSRLPYNILWKWDADNLPGKSSNIKLSKWVPQYDVLRHPNLKLFITHGGLQSTDEAINAGVPVLGIPQFSDQEYNTEKYAYFKIGTKLDYKTLNVYNFESAINTILTNYNSYKQNVVQLRTQMHDQPLPALEHVMRRIEYILRHGGVQHLRAPAANMSWVQYYELEIVLIVLGAMLALGTVFLITIYASLRGLLRFTDLKVSQIKVSLNKKSINLKL